MQPPLTENPEQEYLRMKVILYKNLFKYCAVVAIIVLVKEIFRAIFYAKYGAIVVLSIFVILVAFLIYFNNNLKTNQELFITIYLGLFYLCALLAQYYTKSGYLDHPLDSFNFAFTYAAFERIVVARISKFSYRIAFVSCTTIIRVIAIKPPTLSLFLVQFVYLGFAVYLDYDREKYDKNFFLSYFKNKEQLLKFKNLVVQDIPEGILIVTQDLAKPLFMNKSLEELFQCELKLNLRAKLQQLILQERSYNTDGSSKKDSNRTSNQGKSLLVFLESIIGDQTGIMQAQKYSCNLSYKRICTEQNIEGTEQEHIFETKVVNLMWDDQPAIAIILHDITQQHTILNLKMADAHKDAILATVSHELRTPLNGILGMIQIMEKKVKESDMLNYLSVCKNSGKLLLSLVNSILDLNQIQANRLKLNIERVCLRELLEGILSLFQYQCNLKSLYLKLKISPVCPTHILTDKNRLSQIFINLIGNALKFTSAGGITVTAHKGANNDLIAFDVEDSGVGIKDEDKKKLFQVFGKLEQNDKNVNPHGVGLGLTISDKLTRLLSGDETSQEGIRLESQYGRGSRFMFSVRKILKEHLTTEELEFSPVTPNFPKNMLDEKGDVDYKMLNYSREYVKSSQKYTLNLPASRLNSEPAFPNVELLKHNYGSYALIVDDNPLNLIIAESLISSQGYKTKSAMYGQVAIDTILNCNFAKEPIKLIFMDCQMPIMDGFTVTRTLKKLMLEKKIPEIPIVALTANDSESDREASLRAGMCEHLAKPMKEGELVRILRKYMS